MRLSSVDSPRSSLIRLRSSDDVDGSRCFMNVGAGADSKPMLLQLTLRLDRTGVAVGKYTMFSAVGCCAVEATGSMFGLGEIGPVAACRAAASIGIVIGCGRASFSSSCSISWRSFIRARR